MLKLDDIRIKNLRPISSPAVLVHELPVSTQVAELVQTARDEASKVMQGEDDRLLVIVGPCSIHDTKAALEYGERLAKLKQQYQNELCIIMRVYFEKPRTTVGWKGLINDPNLDGSFDINAGLKKARQLLVDLGSMGVPAGTEFLDTIIPQYISDLICWGAIGARTTESQVHRELASGLSMPVGFKNGTDGNIKIAIDALMSSRHPHCFLSISKLGVPIIAETVGNDATHVILRGSTAGPNYKAEQVAAVVKSLAAHKLPEKVMIDCSHGNSHKDHEKQVEVALDVAQQIKSGSHAIAGVMLESHLKPGNQALNQPELEYGKSITDACMGWEATEKVLAQLAESVIERRKG